MKSHKHAEVIIAYANGAEIECKSPAFKIWLIVENPAFYNDNEYRVKNTPKTSLTRRELCEIYNTKAEALVGHDSKLEYLANLVIARYIQDNLG